MAKFERMNFKEIEANKDEFLRRYNLASDFERSECKWDELMFIAEDFNKRRQNYATAVQKYLMEIAEFESVHSYRHRIKDIDSLIKKVITKACKGNNFGPINVDNYRVRVTDLIGIRILYVFKSDYYAVHQQIWDKYEHQMKETIQIKLRSGDDITMFDKIPEHRRKIEEDESYRSIHYIMSINEQDSKDARLEIQTRTVFEEGWSEINHKLVYKNKDVAGRFLLSQASTILSALVGNCDTLGELMKDIHNDYLERMAQVTQNISDKKPDEILQEVLADFLKNKI